MIPHASDLQATAATARAFSIPVVETAFGALPMATTGTAKAIATPFDSTLRAAVDVPTIARAADAEQLLTARTAIDSQGSRMGGHGIRRGPKSQRLRRSRIDKTCDNPGRSSLCACSRQGARPLEGPEFKLRVLTCFGTTVGQSGRGRRGHESREYRLLAALGMPTHGMISAAFKRNIPSARSGVHRFEMGKTEIWTEMEAGPQLAAKCSDFYVFE